jgi:hypothetical protein
MTKQLCVPVVALAIFSASAFADEKANRSAGAHAHGKGTLNIAIEGGKVEIELEAPGADIVGFEHQAKSADQKAELEKAKITLKDGLTLFKLPAGAGCKIDTATVEVHADGEGHDDHDSAKEEAGKKPSQDHDHDEKKGDGGGHSEFHANYILTCAEPYQLTGLEALYFTSFPGAQSLAVNITAAKGQSQTELTRDNPKLDFAGVM